MADVEKVTHKLVRTRTIPLSPKTTVGKLPARSGSLSNKNRLKRIIVNVHAERLPTQWDVGEGKLPIS
jgi:hypothetical protein